MVRRFKKKARRKCYHRKTRIIVIYRKNYPFGRKSDRRSYDPPKLCVEVCLSCKKEIDKWRPTK